MTTLANLPANALANFPAQFGLRTFDAEFDPFAGDGSGAVAIGRLVDARICQLRQLCRARGLFESDMGEEESDADLHD